MAGAVGITAQGDDLTAQFPVTAQLSGAGQGFAAAVGVDYSVFSSLANTVNEVTTSAE